MGKIWSPWLKNDLLPNTRAVVALLKAVTETIEATNYYYYKS